MRFREGDFIETKNNLIFDVKGMVHPPKKIIAYIRYIPDKEGERQRDGQRFRKIYDLSERNEYLKKNYPEYILYDIVFDEVMNMVPIKDLSIHYKPIEKTHNIQIKSTPNKEEKKTSGIS